MLPVNSPSDTYRAGYWAARLNPGVILVWVGLAAAHDHLASILLREIVFGSPGPGGSMVISLWSLAIRTVLVALLVLPLHATFLSDGRATGFAAIGSLDRLCRVALRSLLIFVAALIPASIYFAVAARLLGGGFGDLLWAFHAAGLGDLGAETVLARHLLILRLIFVPLFGASVILLGLGIPRIVDRGTPGPLSGSLRWGEIHFRPMAAKLATGPGLVLVAHEFVQWRVIEPETYSFTGVPPLGMEIASGLLALVVYAYCAAMTAGVLSDAYRRAAAAARPREANE